MSLQAFRDSLPDYARDTKINLGSVISEDGAPGLNTTQIWGSALACAYATKSRPLIEAFEHEVKSVADETLITSARGAATIMAMNNIYYRSTHLMDDEEISKLPAKLRMTFIGNPGINKVDFEVICLAVSAVNGCGKCLVAHQKVATHAGVSNEGIQSALRIASVVNAAAQAQFISGL